jgi:hypothetical protein
MCVAGSLRSTRLRASCKIPATMSWIRLAPSSVNAASGPVSVLEFLCEESLSRRRVVLSAGGCDRTPARSRRCGDVSLRAGLLVQEAGTEHVPVGRSLRSSHSRPHRGRRGSLRAHMSAARSLTRRRCRVARRCGRLGHAQTRGHAEHHSPLRVPEHDDDTHRVASGRLFASAAASPAQPLSVTVSGIPARATEQAAIPNSDLILVVPCEAPPPAGRPPRFGQLIIDVDEVGSPGLRARVSQCSMR